MRKNDSLRLCLAVLVIICCLAATATRAETPDAGVLPKKLVIKEFSFDREAVAEALFSVVFAYPYRTPQDSPFRSFWKFDKKYGALSTAQGYKTRYPWLYEYIYREKGMPDYWGLNKWAKPVTISFGLPLGLKPAAGTPDDNAALSEETAVEPTDETRKIAEEEIKAAIPFLSENTGLNISYLPPEKETEENISTLRIVFLKDPPENPLQQWRGRGPGRLSFRKDIAARYLHTAIHFTPDRSHHVRGFYLPEADNSIGMAFCFVPQNHPPDMLKSMIRECLVRSMGLPGYVAAWPNTLLGPWNEPEKEIKNSRTIPFANSPPNDTLTEFHKSIGEKHYYGDPRIFKAKPPVPYGVFEKTMLRALYHSSVERGMSRLDLIRLLALPTE